MKRMLMTLVACALLTFSCKKNKETDSEENGVGGIDPTTYAQYITCKIDGTVYTAYYAPGHTTNLNCVYNTIAQTNFETNADQQQVGDIKLLSDLRIILFGFQTKKAFVYTMPSSLHLNGTLERMVNGTKQRITYTFSKGATLTVATYKDGIIEGTFSGEAQADDNDAIKYKITDGKFKMKVE